jgi:hypothetical protein
LSRSLLPTDSAFDEDQAALGADQQAVQPQLDAVLRVERRHHALPHHPRHDAEDGARVVPERAVAEHDELEAAELVARAGSYGHGYSYSAYAHEVTCSGRSRNRTVPGLSR